MKIIRFLLLIVLFVPCVSFGAGGSDFQNAARLLSAARRGDTQTIQILLNSGVDINYTDATGLSLVCTAVMNNDKQAIQILQMYGADASGCDRQIKKYKQRTKTAAKGEEYNFFSGLSSSHVVALSALGIAAVIGGVALLSNIFDDDHGNHNSSSSGGSRPGSGEGDVSAGDALFAQNLPYGPLCKNGTCPTDFSEWETNAIPLRKLDFDFMSNPANNFSFNYLMASYAYDSFIRGYLGMNTIRIGTSKAPFDLETLPYVAADRPDGGKPVNVTMVTGTGVNQTGSAADGYLYWFDDSQISFVQNTCKANGENSEACQNALAAAKHVSHKYGNYSSSTGAEVTAFDLSDSGTVFGNASESDTILAKIIAGWETEERTTGDYYGFIPNGQVTVYKTGNGQYFGTPDSSAVATGTYDFGENSSTIVVGGTLGLFGKTLTVATVDGNDFTATVGTGDEMVTYHGYVIGETLYIDSGADGNINQAYTIGTGNELTLTKTLQQNDYKTFSAISKAIAAQNSGVIVNLALPAASVGLDYVDVMGAKGLYTDGNASVFTADTGLINQYYNYDGNDEDTNISKPNVDADNAFSNLGVSNKQIWVNPAGWNKFGSDAGASLTAQYATFENFMPVIEKYKGLQNRFMTVVAVRPGNANGTNGQSIANYSAANVGKLELSTWEEDGTHYSSRICGLAGTGNDGAINPWCFAAPGRTNLEATAAMAGGVALVQSAFDYMSAEQVFLLLALTADGPYLGTDPTSTTATTWTSDDLIKYLKERYSLPDGMGDSSDVYLYNFKQAFGYGVINLERATRPGTNVYFFDGKKIVSGSGSKPYWGTALKSTNSRGSSVFSLNGRSAIKTSFYDVLQSLDGTIVLPRVWKNTIAMNTGDDKHGLYMGDVLGDFNIDSANKRTNKIGNFQIDMVMSSRAYDDNLNGLDDMRIAWNNDCLGISAEYQHHLTDSESRFDGRANSLLNLVSNSVSSGAMYKYGRFGLGGRVFVGAITDENLLDKDPVISSQFEPGRLGLANGGAMNAKYSDDKFGLNISVGDMHENNTVLGMVSEGALSLRGANTKYIDAVATYNPFDKVKLSLRGMYAVTDAVADGLLITDLSDIKSNSFAFGVDIRGFSFTAAMPLAVVDGRLGYGYADFDVVENDGKYSVAVNNPHIEYIDLSALKRELRFTTTYKQALGEFTDAGFGFIYRVNPNNTDAFGNESIFMFKLHHRLGI